MKGLDSRILLRMTLETILEPISQETGDEAAKRAAITLASIIKDCTPGNYSEHCAFSMTLLNELSSKFRLRVSFIPGEDKK